MGKGFTIACAACGYSQSLLLGIGMGYAPAVLEDPGADFSILTLLARFHRLREQVRPLLTERHGRLVWDDYGHAVCRCPRCQGIYARFLFRLEHDGGTFTPNYRCPKCRIALEPLSGNGEEEDQIDWAAIPCPKCGQHRLAEAEHICWD